MFVEIPAHSYEKLVHLAKIAGQSESEYLADILENLDSSPVLQLSKADSEQLAQHLINPPPMNDAMKRAMAHYKANVVEIE